MLPRRIFREKPSLCPEFKETPPISGRISRSRSQDFIHDQYLYNLSKRRSCSTESLPTKLDIPEPAKAIRPLNLDELFPDRAKMNSSEIIKNVAPIIVITQDSENEYDGDDDGDETVEQQITEDTGKKDSAKTDTTATEKPTETQEPEQAKVIAEKPRTEDSNVKNKDAKEEKKKVEPKVTSEKEVNDVNDANAALLVKLVKMHNSGWFDSDVRKHIKPTPKGWQLLQV